MELMRNKQAEMIKNISDEVLVVNVFITQGLVLLVAVILGFFLFDDFSEVTSLFQWKDWNILIMGGSVGLGIVIYDLVLMKIVPASYFDDGGINERIFRNLSYFKIFLVTLTIAVCEEMLFRGVIQQHTNVWIASLIFALVHYRYLFNPFLFFNVTLLSFLIGLLYEHTANLYVTITAHFIIDFLLGIYIKVKYRKTIKQV